MPSQSSFPPLPELFTRDTDGDLARHTHPNHRRYPFVETNLVIFRNPTLSAPGTRVWVFAEILETFYESPWFLARTSTENFTGSAFLLTDQNAPTAVRESFAANVRSAHTSRDGEVTQLFNADTVTNVIAVMSITAVREFLVQARNASDGDSVAK